ncbi:MAG TPA: proprotein convertase P-domain-containing protein [Thermoanaerobaculia bacterium]|nr:proprotein convertase P-domain-containing protein [Thermoanaerobaculia bacterium]
MNDIVRRFAAAALVAAGFSAVLPGTATAQIMQQHEGNNLASLSLMSDKLHPSPTLEAMDGVRGNLAAHLDAAWATFQLNHGAWNAHLDSRSGRIESAEGAGIAWIPGRGNRLTRADLKGVLGAKSAPDLAVLEKLARRFVDGNSALLGLSSKELALNAGRSGKVADYLWFVDFDVLRAGIPVEGARVVFRVNHGNLIQFGMENVPPAGVTMPAVKITKEQAFATVSDYVGGIFGQDKIVDAGSLHLLPTAERDSRFAEGFAFGKGYGLASVWQVTFKRDGVQGTWRARVDATSGEMLELYDVNDYAQANGGVILNLPSLADTVRAMPFTNVAVSTFANSGGLYNFTGATTSSLAGQYVTITDRCGSISAASNVSGDIPFGSSASGTDCTTPGTGGLGNTRSARTQFYWLNRIKEVGRGWLPGNAWLNAKLVADVNQVATCNAYWDGTKVNFFKASSPCGNTGQIPGVSIHEYGHGLDNNDGNGSSPDNGTGETIGDFTAALALHQSCVGPGFLPSNCAGYGNACTSCTGVRDIDWAKHSRNVASTVSNFTQTTCPQPSANNPNYVGPCGKDAISRGVTANKREGHCESYITSESLWDFANRDLPSPGTGSAWTITDRLWYLSRSTGTQGFTCNTSGGTWTSDGCNTGSMWKVMRAVDDDNGNLTDGTPHGGALFAAFNRHGIACPSDAGASTTFAGCAAPTVPTMTLTGGSNSAVVSWTSSGVGVVYDVYRNESGCNAGFVKVANDTSAVSFADAAVANGTTYFYQVVAHPSGNEACGGAPATCQSVTPAPVACTPPAAPTGVSATATGTTTATVSWTASAGATGYNILRGTVSGGPYNQVGTSATTSFADSGLTCNTAYFYVVQATNAPSCASGNSAQGTTTTNTCPIGGNQVLTFSAAPALAIPDNNTTGITSTINVAAGQTVTSVSVTVGITHTFQGDLEVALIGPDNTTVLLHNLTGAGTDNINTTYAILTVPAQALTAFTGKNTAGAWKLRVRDLGAADVGTLNSWKLTFNGYSTATVSTAIPDNNTTGITSTINVAATGTVTSLSVRVAITHTFQGDLEVALIGPDNTTVLLHNRTGAGTDNINTVYSDLTAPAQALSAFTGKATNGAWKLRVRDLAAADTGTFTSWALDLR